VSAGHLSFTILSAFGRVSLRETVRRYRLCPDDPAIGDGTGPVEVGPLWLPPKVDSRPRLLWERDACAVKDA